MSDLFAARQKVEQGADWRDDINVSIDGEEHELTIRQLRDPEFWEVMSLIDTDELDQLQSDLPEEKVEEFNELQNKEDGLTDEEQERMEELQNEMEEEDISMFDTLSFETYQGIKQAAIYGVEPDEQDIKMAMAEHADEIEDNYGGLKRENAKRYANDHVIEPMINRATDFSSFAIGVKVFGQSLGDEGN